MEILLTFKSPKLFYKTSSRTSSLIRSLSLAILLILAIGRTTKHFMSRVCRCLKLWACHGYGRDPVKYRGCHETKFYWWTRTSTTFFPGLATSGTSTSQTKALLKQSSDTSQVESLLWTNLGVLKCLVSTRSIVRTSPAQLGQGSPAPIVSEVMLSVGSANNKLSTLPV
jgi:hypothetical protein